MFHITLTLRRCAFASALVVLILAVLSGSGGSVAGAASTGQAQPSHPALLTDVVQDPKQPNVLWFAPTGHTLRGVFQDYWIKYGGLSQFGYPLTEEFFESVGPDNTFIRVQYFERNRFEYHPEYKDTQYEVLLGALGRDFHTQDPPATRVRGGFFFGETGHNLLDTFKSYWEIHGGSSVHGYPITEAYQERNAIDGKTYLVQYFERSRFEYHPEHKGTQYEVLLGLLGRQLSAKKGYPYGWYPLYGYAADYSWFAGHYQADPTRCRDCGCSTVVFVQPSNKPHPNVVSVLPYGPDWDPMLAEKGIIATVQPQKFIVVFGQLDDPNSMAASKPVASCTSPKFRVTDLEFNPIR